MSLAKYILDENGNPVIEPDLFRWAEWFEHSEHRILEQTYISPEVKVSTIFLGLDMSFFGTRPILWETMVFGGRLNYSVWRYHTRESAIEGHRRAVQAARESLEDDE